MNEIQNNKKVDKAKGIFVGLTTLDYVYYVDRYPNNNSKVKTNDYKRYVGGPAANAAITYSLLGGDATLVTCLGKSDEEILLKGLLEQYGVKVINCSRDNEMPNIATIIVDKQGNRTIFSGQKKYSEIDIPQIDKADFCLFDLNQQEISIDILNGVEGDVVLDAGSWKPNAEKFLKRAQIVISSENFKNPEGKNIFEIEECNSAYLAITRGEKDILLKQSENRMDSIFVDSSVNCVDSLGAGDIFHGAFCYAFYEKKLVFAEALAFAGKIAQESVKYYGPREWVKHI